MTLIAHFSDPETMEHIFDEEIEIDDRDWRRTLEEGTHRSSKPVNKNGKLVLLYLITTPEGETVFYNAHNF